MAAKPKADDPPKDEEDADKKEGESEQAAPKKAGLVGRVLAPLFMLGRFAGFLNPLKILKLPLKLKLIAIAGLLVVILGGGSGVYFFLLSGGGEEEAKAPEQSVQTAETNLPSEQASFFDIPDIIVNIQSADSTPAYLKLSVALELDKPELKMSIEPVLPRVVDQFQTYLRELRVEDIRGSAGVMRLKEELLRRVNLAVAPTPVRDVLFKEMIVQ
jgi:flagellar FliL protein